jgi:SAM-dependent methyltransferase
VASVSSVGWLRSWKNRSSGLSYGREIVSGWARLVGGAVPIEALDVGCGVGSDLLGVRDALAPRRVVLHGIDVYAPSITKAIAAGIDVRCIDIEREPLPFSDGSFDYVIANQVLEHTKELFWILSEIGRVLRVGGFACVGVPNLASLHNRLLLAFGRQPTSIELLGPHVRGFTLPALRRLLTTGGQFAIIAEAGANFYPFAPPVAARFATWWPAGAASIFVLARKTPRAGRFLDAVRPEMAETNYFLGSTA